MRYIYLIFIILIFTSGCLESKLNKDNKNGKLELNNVMSVFTDKDTYHSNETMKVFIDFNSPEEGKGELSISGLKNILNKELIKESRDIEIEKGYNQFISEFKTPFCGECSSLKPGMYFINVSIKTGGKTYMAYTKVRMEESKNE